MARSRPSPDPVFQAQFEEVVKAGLALKTPVLLEPAPPTEPGGVPAFVYHKNHLLVTADVPTSHSLLQELGARPAPPTSEALLGKEMPPMIAEGRAKLLTIDQQPEGRTVLDVIKALDERGLRGKVSPNHFVSICPVNLCPATEPEPSTTTPGSPQPAWSADPADGLGVVVHVVDTGIIKNSDASTYPHVFTAAGPVSWNSLNDPYVPPPPTPGSNGTVKPYGGHGMFVAGVLKWFAPGVTLHEWKLLQMAGGIMEDALADGLMNALNQSPDIISLSAGGTTFKDLPYLALRPVYDRLRQPTCKTLLVAAAGNDGETEPFYPAATHAQPDLRSAVVSVGALRKTGDGRACFSNYGDWVQVYAPGEKHVNAFPPGNYKYHEPSSTQCRYYPPPSLYFPCTCVGGPPAGSVATIGRWAHWSGTSFATPLVAGRIAAYMTKYNEPNARTAAQQFFTQNTVSVTDPVDGVVISALPLTTTSSPPITPITQPS